MPWTARKPTVHQLKNINCHYNHKFWHLIKKYCYLTITYILQKKKLGIVSQKFRSGMRSIHEHRWCCEHDTTPEMEDGCGVRPSAAPRSSGEMGASRSLPDINVHRIAYLRWISASGWTRAEDRVAVGCHRSLKDINEKNMNGSKILNKNTDLHHIGVLTFV
jgi:hypothetical protein